jgi:aldehyde dehydrogenase (NAD+)
MNYKTNVQYRKESLKKLLYLIQKNEEAIIKALHDDFKKSAFEAVLTETSYVITDLKQTINSINTWAKPKRVLPSILNFPSSDSIYSEPYGKVLIIAPWNYPFQLALCPLIAAVAAGNQVVVKPSELTPNTSAIIAKIITKTFHKNHVEVIEGDVAIAQQLLALRWDYIFFTGSVSVGKIVSKAAAQFMTPVTLELGGKNPCIVDETADLKLAAKRIVWGKFVNAGQTCIAPDFVLIHEKIKLEFISFLKQEIINSYGKNPELSADFPRIINAKNWQRLCDLLIGNQIIMGGEANPSSHYIAPTLVDEPSLDSLIMKDEIFGPILPLISYTTENDIKAIISRYEKPLALYVFSTNSGFSNKIINDFSFGGGCVNDTMIHFANKRLPFGGVGHSGIGAYHGKRSFDTFSHKKAVVKKANWLDLPMRYAPYEGKLKAIRNFLKWL